MKKLLLVVALAVLASGPANASIEGLVFQEALNNLVPMDLINWKVGDTASYDVKVASFGKIGTNVKAVTKDEGTSIWLTQDMNLSGQKQLAEAQISKADGKILKLIVNGKEQAIPNDPIEIISQDYGEVTVPAGTFQCIHIIAKSKQVSKLEAWMNPRDTVMDGTIKQIAQTQLFPLTMELTSFKRAP